MLDILSGVTVPALGEHTDEVLRRMLGMEEEEIESMNRQKKNIG